MPSSHAKLKKGMREAWASFYGKVPGVSCTCVVGRKEDIKDTEGT